MTVLYCIVLYAADSTQLSATVADSWVASSSYV